MNKSEIYVSETVLYDDLNLQLRQKIRQLEKQVDEQTRTIQRICHRLKKTCEKEILIYIQCQQLLYYYYNFIS